ncbi:MAG: single-stranded DNA-binding protein [Bradymonadales bacterium]|jgi:single-strand DNA-binding protein
MGVNKVMLVGRLGKDVELRTAQSGKPVGKFSLATDSGFGENRKTEWHNIVTFDRVAENCSKYIGKGSLVYVEGRISYSKWEKEPGNVINITSILAHDVQFLDSKGSSGERSNYGDNSYANNYSAPPSYSQPSAAAEPDPPYDDGFLDENIPF